MQELGIPGRLEKYMTFSMNNELSSSLYRLVKNLSKGDFKYFNQEFGNTITSTWVILKGLKKNCLAKKTFIIPLPIKKTSGKECKHVSNVWNNFKMKKMKDYHNLYLKCDVLLLADVFEKFKDNSLKNYRLCPSHY